jgi:hypothetical protein
MTNRKAETMAETEEGPRAFSRFIEMIADGDAHMEMSHELHSLMKVMADHSSATTSTAKGELAINFKFAMDPKGLVAVGYEVKVKEPKLKRASGVLFLTKGNNLQSENPRQAKLPLREVAAPQPRDAGSDTQTAREAQ